MHQDAAGGVISRCAVSVNTGNIDARLAERLDIVPLIAEFRGVVQYQERPVGRCCATRCGLKVPCQDIGLVDPVIIEEPIGRFRVRPVLADQRDAVPGTTGQLLEQGSKSLSQSLKAVLGYSAHPTLRCFTAAGAPPHIRQPPKPASPGGLSRYRVTPRDGISLAEYP